MIEREIIHADRSRPRFADLEVGDRFTYHHTVWEVANPPVLNDTGKKVTVICRVLGTTKPNHWARHIGREITWGLLTKTCVNRIVYKTCPIIHEDPI